MHQKLGLLASLLSLVYIAVALEAVPRNEHDVQWIQPFYRELSVQTPLLNGSDVVVLQHLIARSSFSSKAVLSGVYDVATAEQVKLLQAGLGFTANGVVDASLSKVVLDKFSRDNYRDDGTIPAGYAYKVHIPVYANRSIETIATLYAANMTVLHRFTVRTHGQNDAQGNALNMFAGDGATPTGLSSLDLNSPEPDPVSYGPYPINRFVQGMRGNAAFLISDIRNGILIHTGEWADWDPSQPMPNSHGCVHGHPDDINQVWQILVSLGVEIHKNPFGERPYPYIPQGVVSVEQLD